MVGGAKSWGVLGVWLVVGCGSAPPPRTATAEPSSRSAEAVAVPKPRCAASAPNAPMDAKPVMRQAGEEVKGCFMMGKATSKPSSVAVELNIAEKGSVLGVSANASGAEREQLACVESTMKKQRFSTFCGADVTLRWTYALVQ